MLLVEKEINKGIFAQIKRYPVYAFDGETVVGQTYAIQIFTPRKEASIQRVGTVSRYASYDSLSQAQKIFVYKYGDILPIHLRGSCKANYLKKLGMSNDADNKPSTSSKTASSTVASTKPKKLGILDTLRKVMAECKESGYSREECVEYCLLEQFKQASVTRIANELFGKVEKAKKGKSASVATIQPSKYVPSPIAPKVLDLRDRLIQARQDGWSSHVYNVDEDLKKFQSRKFIGSKKFAMV